MNLQNYLKLVEEEPEKLESFSEKKRERSR